MFSHIAIGTNDLEKATAFYDAVFAALGAGPGTDMGGRMLYSHKGAHLLVTPPVNGEPAVPANGGTIAFIADSVGQVDAWHETGTSLGGTTCEDPPGVRKRGASLYVAYMRDPDGNKLCAVHTMNE